jgi:hypothetical protein
MGIYCGRKQSYPLHNHYTAGNSLRFQVVHLVIVGHLSEVGAAGDANRNLTESLYLPDCVAAVGDNHVCSGKPAQQIGWVKESLTGAWRIDGRGPGLDENVVMGTHLIQAPNEAIEGKRTHTHGHDNVEWTSHVSTAPR